MEIIPNNQDLQGKILLVDDEPLVLEMLAETLRESGHDIVAVTDAEDGKRSRSYFRLIAHRHWKYWSFLPALTLAFTPESLSPPPNMP